ncbi:MAG: right-handed parallel beta-helix repeat-containing protein [Ruminococcaceae bacterium]|nr:right-handed parallel beta-helix repeat-containing protein [Oscillospiraceae bacterium]
MTKRILSAVLVLVMLAAMLPAFPFQARAEENTYVLDATADLAPMSAGTKQDGDFDTVGTDGYFTLIYAAKTKIDSSNKTFDDGYTASQRINFQSKTNVEKGMVPAISFTTSAAATIKLWWVEGGDDNRQFAIYNSTGEIIAKTEETLEKNALCISELSVDAAGTYFLGVPDGSNYLFKMEVTEQAAEPVIITNTLDATADLAPMSAGTKQDGDFDTVGTNGYFTLIYAAKTKIDSSNKTFEDGYTASQRINFQSKTNVEKGMVPAISFTTTGPATVKFWWVEGGDDNRQFALYNSTGEIVAKTNETLEKNALCISELTVDAAGTYFLGVPDGSNYLFKLEVTEVSGGPVVETRKDWSEVAAPVITAATDDGEGSMHVTVNAVVGKDGGDELFVTMYDAQGNEIATRRSIAEKGEHALLFEPENSGEYTFKAVLLREEQPPKESDESLTAYFKLVLTDPILISATSKGGGTVELVWVGAKEATAYEIYAGETLLGTTSGTIYMAEGLTVGQEYAFTIVAVRGEDRTTSAPVSTKVTQEAQQTWGFTYYGPSTNAAGNGYVGSVNEDGYVTVYSEGGKGKIQPKSLDGLAFYYTAVPASMNFTLRAKVTVDSWELSNGQEGFGLMAADRLGTSGDSAGIWNNAYMALASKIEYKYEGGEDSLHVYDTSYDGGTKITMKMGLGALSKTGITKENLPAFEAGDTTVINRDLLSLTMPLEWAAAEWGKEAGTYNVIGNYTQAPGGDIELEMLTSFILEIQKNNTGYFITYYDDAGNILCRQKYYDTEALSQLDNEFVYAGFFASRNARATFSDVYFATIDPKDDAPAEEKPVTKIQPSITFATDTVCNSLNYQMMIDANVSGTAKVTVAGNTVLENVQIMANQRAYLDIPLATYGKNRVQVIFTPDPDQDLGPDTVLSSTKDVTETLEIIANKGNYHQKVIYASPTGLPTGNGTKEQPYDIYTAVDNAVAGQTIVLLEGTYKMLSSLRIKRGFDGTEDARINMIADPEAATRPVIDFQGLYSGITHGGDYWYFYGFDVTGSVDGQKGFQVSGNNNILDQINTYYNGNTGIQISRYNGKDLMPDWPANNLVLNCTSYCNYDKGFEDADGFAAKLTCGEGNVFDGCLAYNNADDGWDLYAKIETGPIGAVTIRNCVAHSNGWVPGVEGEGNGNGFKMGGDSLTGYHVLENSYAFFNRSKGIDSNSCPDIQVYNCVSYNNGSYNVAFYTNNAANTDYFATGIISFKDSTNPHADGMVQEQLKPKGTQDTAKIQGLTNYYWNGSATVNSAGDAITADLFVSLQFGGITRNEDGSLNLQGFLQMSENGPADAGVPAGAGSPSRNPAVLPENLAHNLPDAWSYLDQLSGHWRECDCGFKAELAAHTYKWVIDREPTPTASGEKHEECTVCGYKAPAVTTYYEGSTEPSEPATQPTNPTTSAEPDGGNVVVIVIAVVLVVAIGAFVVFKFVIKKKEN